MTEKEIHIEQLMMEKLIGTISEENSHYLDGLLQSDEEIHEQWEKIKQTFEDSEPHHYLQNVNTDIAWMQLRHGIDEKKINRKAGIKKWAIAASLMIPLLFAGWFYYYSQNNKSSVAKAQQPDNSVKLYVNGTSAINLSQYNGTAQLPALKNNINLKVRKGSLSYVSLNKEVNHTLNTLVVPTTTTYNITLSDGTKVSLNSLSQLKFPFVFTENKREVWLKGEAYFKVAKDEKHPFIVHTPLTTIKVLGTEFNVNTYDSLHVKTALVSGSIRTAGTNGESILLKPGHEAVFTADNGFNVRPFDGLSVLSWMHGIYYFQNSKLEDIVAVAYRWYGDSIVFDNPEVASSRFSGALLKNKPLKEFLNNLSFTSNIRYFDENGEIHIATK